MKQDFERLAPAPDWCTAAAYLNPVPAETLDHIERELAKLMEMTPPCPSYGFSDMPAYFWFILIAVLAVTLL